MIICDYGCGREGKCKQTTGKWCCNKFYTQCPELRRKNSKGNRGISKVGHVAWNKGLTKDTDKRIRRQSESRKGIIFTEEHKRRLSKSNKGIPAWNKGKKCPQLSLDNNSNLRGGVSFGDYCQDWTKDLKEYIRERDNGECQNPDCWGKCNNITMTVHHTDYDKLNCVPENLITLCRSCNARANYNRDKWQQLYSTIVEAA